MSTIFGLNMFITIPDSYLAYRNNKCKQNINQKEIVRYF